MSHNSNVSDLIDQFYMSHFGIITRKPHESCHEAETENVGFADIPAEK